MSAPTSWTWTFFAVNGITVLGTSQAQSPQFTYPGPGTYPVTLQVSNSAGGDQLQQSVSVQPLGVRATGGRGSISVF
jgi:PKD repeat protein